MAFVPRQARNVIPGWAHPVPSEQSAKRGQNWRVTKEREKGKEMARGNQTKGACAFCGREMTRSGMARHLDACPKRKEAVAAAEAKGGTPLPIYHLQVQDAWGGDYWLHLEMDGNATLECLDQYLRAIWLECCGHMSRFSVGGWGGEEKDFEMKALEVFGEVGELTHQYDFGTTSETLIKARGFRRGMPLAEKPIYLMARNHQLPILCAECGEPATHLCFECLYEEGEEGTLCAKHAASHAHEDYGEPAPLVNSPRVGMCGYTGPADPPY